MEEARLLIARSHTIAIGLHTEQISKLMEFLLKLEFAANAAETLLKWDAAGGAAELDLDEDGYVEHIRNLCEEIGAAIPEFSIMPDQQ